MKRDLAFRPAAQRELSRMDRVEAERILRALRVFADTGRGDVKALKGPLKGVFRLRVGKWRVFFGLDSLESIIVVDVDNRGQAY